MFPSHHNNNNNMDFLFATKEQLKTLVKSMLDEGSLDIQFQQLQSLQDESNPKFITEVVTVYINDAHKIITILGQHMSQNVINFVEMEPIVHQIKGSSSSIGARNVTLACGDLLSAVYAKNKEMCLTALNKIRTDYCYLRDKLSIVLQLENTIYTTEKSQNLQVGGRFVGMQ